jgi:hypothetical protein
MSHDLINAEGETKEVEEAKEVEAVEEKTKRAGNLLSAARTNAWRCEHAKRDSSSRKRRSVGMTPETKAPADPSPRPPSAASFRMTT